MTGLAFTEEQHLADLGADFVPAGRQRLLGSLLGSQGKGFLRPHHDQGILVLAQTRGQANGDALALEAACAIAVGLDAQEVGVAQERGHKRVGRVLVKVVATAKAHDFAMAEDRDTLGQAHGLFLVMGDVDDGNAKTPVQLAQFILQVFTQLLVQGTQRFVHQQDARLVDQCPGDGHALLLPARHLRGLAVRERLQLHQLEHGIDTLAGFNRTQLANGQGEANVVAHVQVRKQRIALKHHADVALVRRHVDQRLALNEYLAAAGSLKASQHRQGGGLAGAA